MDTPLSCSEQLPCGAACTCKPGVAPVPLGERLIPSREKTLDQLRSLREQVRLEQDAVEARMAADGNYRQWLVDYGSALDGSIYALTPPAEPTLALTEVRKKF
jgi:hypothetical protein